MSKKSQRGEGENLRERLNRCQREERGIEMNGGLYDGGDEERGEAVLLSGMILVRYTPIRFLFDFYLI